MKLFHQHFAHHSLCVTRKPRHITPRTDHTIHYMRDITYVGTVLTLSVGMKSSLPTSSSMSSLRCFLLVLGGSSSSLRLPLHQRQQQRLCQRRNFWSFIFSVALLIVRENRYGSVHSTPRIEIYGIHDFLSA